jgi:hypothetical protein
VSDSGETQKGPPATVGPSPVPAATVALAAKASPEPVPPTITASPGTQPPVGKPPEVINLGDIPGLAEATGAIKPGSKSIDEEADRRFSKLQAWFGGSLLGLLGVTIVLEALLYASKKWTSLDASDIRDYGALIVGPLITLVASVVGFYFGERRRG